MASAPPLSILIYGDFAHDQLAASYERAFQQLQHTVIRFDSRQSRLLLSPALRNRITHRLTIKSLAVRRYGSRRLNRAFISTAQQSRPDIILILNGEYLMPETIRAVRAYSSAVFIFHADNPFPTYSNYRPETLRDALECDCYFIWSRLLVERLREMGVRRVEYLPFGWDNVIFPYIGMSGDPKNDIVFIGGWDKQREEFLTPLAKLFNLKIWGPSYWNTRTKINSPLRRCWQGSAIYGADAAKVIVDSKITLNILRNQNLPDGVIMRTFEVPGCGGFLLSNRTSGAVELFPEDDAGAYFTDLDECIKKIDMYLADDESRRTIASKAHNIVCSGHQYLDRASEIINVYINNNE